MPVTTDGEPKGVKQQGGLLEVISRSVEIECVPDEIPEHFVVDVTELMIGQSKRAERHRAHRFDEAVEPAAMR